MSEEAVVDLLAVGTPDVLPLEEKLKQERKEAKIDAERAALVTSVAAADFSTLTNRVGYMLNLYPDTRNSDVTLALQYWETFQPELFSDTGILPKNLFKLERQTHLTRVRAKIQNEYGLFLAGEGIRRGRRVREEEMQEAVVTHASPLPKVSVFADETGKTATWIIVAAVWVLDPRSVWTLTKKIEAWKATSAWAKKEVHFSAFGARDVAPLAEYLGVIAENREFLGFKFVAVERARTRRPVEETVLRLHEFMATEGLAHEIQNRRINLPRSLELTIDRESSLDAIALQDARARIGARLRENHGEQASIGWLEAVPSEKSALVQLADLIGGALNRHLNRGEGARNHKDDMADTVIRTLGIHLNQREDERFDSAALIYI
ncbi:MAG: DUF3800 domain-containing protein [Achromobacter sp.]|uniref:DUF3800 domain-containing protein n=1 Tax=Achromobacter sp. TaxID=134375 RepID=UPI0012C09DD3|nr:DUF3800 domain-containing protein [Achromobacter sp.]MPS82399.1 DUF3800 domain-containing protein [Achromobacter sp.]